MEKFSIRNGIIPIPSLQKEDMDIKLRNSLWNLVDCYLNERGYGDNRSSRMSINFEKLNILILVAGEDFFSLQLDTLRSYAPIQQIGILKKVWLLQQSYLLGYLN